MSAALEIIGLCQEITNACEEDADWEGEIARRELDRETRVVVLTLLNARFGAGA